MAYWIVYVVVPHVVSLLCLGDLSKRSHAFTISERISSARTCSVKQIYLRFIRFVGVWNENAFFDLEDAGVSSWHGGRLLSVISLGDEQCASAMPASQD